MKLRKLSVYALMAALTGLPAIGLTSCSDDSPAEKQPEQPQEKPEEIPDGKPDEEMPNGVSKELYDKVHAIYDKTPTGPQTVTTVNRLATLTSICAANDEVGPISVTDAELNGEAVTLVTLGGTDDVEGQATTMEENKKAGFGQSNDYLTAVVGLFEDGTIPKEKPVVVTGISLGGMIAQQLLGEQCVMEAFKLRVIITFGSPITLPLERQNVPVIRFADVHDQIPVMGEMVLRTGMVTPNLKGKELAQKLDDMDEVEKITRTSKYTKMVETHALSYIEDECWGDIDFMGSAQKNNVLELKEKMKFYPAPKLNQ